MKSQKGFSLIELMVVVVIIGFLVGMGLPQYQKYVMKSKRSEGKSLLSGMYTAQKSFYAEWTQYYGDFDAVGYGLEGDLTYGVGFAGAGVAGPATHPFQPFRNAAATFNATVYCARPSPGGAAQSCRSKVGGVLMPQLVAQIPGTAVIAAQTFRFGAATNLDNDPIFDTWEIDQDRVLFMTTDDISQ